VGPMLPTIKPARRFRLLGHPILLLDNERPVPAEGRAMKLAVPPTVP